jgi:hypothetical protein
VTFCALVHLSGLHPWKGINSALDHRSRATPQAVWSGLTQRIKRSGGVEYVGVPDRKIAPISE